MTPVAPVALEVEDVSVRFGGIVALDSVSLSVSAGQIVGVIGPNGAGKTTLFDVISGARTPDGGVVRMDGAVVTDRSAVWRARHGMRRTFQHRQLFGALSVEDNLLVAQEWEGKSGGIVLQMLGVPWGRTRAAQRRARAEAMLEVCGLGEIRHRPAGSLPIGQAQLVELARAVVDGPRILLLDEPSSGLGPVEQDLLSRSIRRIQRDGSCGILLIEHDVGFVMDHCDQVVVLNVGTRIAGGSPEEVQQDPLVRSAYLG